MVKPDEVLSTLEKYILVDGFPIVIDLEKSHGSHIVDARDGTDYLDFYTFFASSPLGLNHPKLANEEFKERVFRAAVNKVANSDIYTVEMAQFVKTFMEFAAPEGYVHLFLIDYGTLAVENALKVAMDWKVRKNLARGYTGSAEKGTKVIHFKEAFHGRSGYTLSLTNTADPRKYMYFTKFNEWPRILNPKIIWPLEEHLEEVKRAEEEALRQIRQAIAENPNDICAIIIETIQGEGGDNHFRPEFLRSLRQICDENEIMLIFDEVQCGMGITGKMWAFQHYGVEPDIFAFGKKSQVCGILANRRVDEVEKNCFVESSRINSTWGGNIVDMVRATRILEIMIEDKVLDHVNSVSKVLHRHLHALQDEFPNLISNVRYKGLMAAFDLPDAALRAEFQKLCYEEKMLVLPTGTKGIRLRPVLTVTEEDLNEGYKKMRNVLVKMTSQR
ncbi:L-lysine 6-transaminase [Thermosediminibacter litoriperuensis]|uniref:L-lysine-epsilon aminotransferase n=1 Tax=Thermosediminibacter litoriperuensis TaxID=291989 RepID=A0A5S5AW51_9FIRM|nr:L-lysine 6-transaminase [Thermosediminibacter litoriperuensis]TYP57578.1 L-lysine 6-transaminase [Thermosediminibacter litoriperuensis]